VERRSGRRRLDLTHDDLPLLCVELPANQHLPELHSHPCTIEGPLHWRNFTLKSGGDQWRRHDLVSGGHDDRDAEGASIEAPKTPSGVGYGEGCPLLSRLGGLRERRELPQRGSGRSKLELLAKLLHFPL